MRYALISDIHGNLPALEAVLADITGRPGIDATYHLGDLVGYGPWPAETIALLRGFRVEGIQGNHDAKVAAARLRDAAPATGALDHREWTIQRTSEESQRFLAALPTRLDLRPRGGHVPGARIVLVHGTPRSIEGYWYEDQPDSFHLEMAGLVGARAGDVICSGHTHLPWHREVEGIHLVNTGSVGRPKDGDWRAGYVLLDVSGERPVVEFVRVEYDLERVVKAIRESELPDHFADYLRCGGVVEEGGQ